MRWIREVFAFEFILGSFIKSFGHNLRTFIGSCKDMGDLWFLFFWLKLSEAHAENQLLDIFVVDNSAAAGKLKVAYVFSSLFKNRRIRLEGFAYKKRGSLFTSCKIFRSGLWLEREAQDLFGVYFSGNVDMRRILLDYTFRGFPLRKDFPLTGYYEVRYDDQGKGIVYEPVELTQDYRMFDFDMEWVEKNVKIKN